MNKKASGFTLIELLVVVAIIAVLISILLPALSQAREKARQAVCLSNQKQLAMAMVMYAQDVGGYFPGIVYWPTPPNYDNNFARPWQLLLPYLNIKPCRRASDYPTVEAAWEGTLRESVHTICPSHAEPFYGGGRLPYPKNAYIEYRRASYGWPYALRWRYTMENTPEPSRKILLVDFANHPFVPTYASGNAGWFLDLYGATSDGRYLYNVEDRKPQAAGARHSGGVVISFADGHAAWMGKPQQTNLLEDRNP